MNELDDFLADTLPRQIKAETAIHNGDVALRLAMWSTLDPVSLLGAASGLAKTGTENVSRVSRWIASRFSNCLSYDFELVAAGVSGDLAYTVGYEHCTRSWDGGPPEDATLRVTHVYRREDGEWKIVHRHGDVPPVDQSPPPPAP
jgi:ketosteroid isomerase-like protein